MGLGMVEGRPWESSDATDGKVASARCSLTRRATTAFLRCEEFRATMQAARCSRGECGTPSSRKEDDEKVLDRVRWEREASSAGRGPEGAGFGSVSIGAGGTLLRGLNGTVA